MRLHIVRALPETPSGLYHRREIGERPLCLCPDPAGGWVFLDLARPPAAVRCPICFHPSVWKGFEEVIHMHGERIE